MPTAIVFGFAFAWMLPTLTNFATTKATAAAADAIVAQNRLDTLFAESKQIEATIAAQNLRLEEIDHQLLALRGMLEPFRTSLEALLGTPERTAAARALLSQLAQMSVSDAPILELAANIEDAKVRVAEGTAKLERQDFSSVDAAGWSTALRLVDFGEVTFRRPPLISVWLEGQHFGARPVAFSYWLHPEPGAADQLRSFTIKARIVGEPPASLKHLRLRWIAIEPTQY